jgi:3-hydroxyisobutyrate dehydrogenase-like beta-hydroxyacid dehydrogenase
VAAQDTVAGFVGLGTMGSALSAHLLAAGWRVAGTGISDAGPVAGGDANDLFGLGLPGAPPS